MTSIGRSIALLFAGALASVIGAILFSPPPPNKQSYILILGIITFSLILYGSGLISKIWHAFYLWKRRGHRLFTARVGILNDMGWEPGNSQISSWSDISPKGWKKEIENWSKENKAKIKVKLISTKKKFDSYFAILNPYGGVYPEFDLKNFETLNKIFAYVREGGLFVNTADVPGYWAYNPFLKRRLNATPLIFSITKILGDIFPVYERHFEFTPFMEKLGLRIMNLQYNELSKWSVEFETKFNKLKENMEEIQVYRAVIVERNVEAIIKTKRFGQTDEITPFFFVNYGDGKFLFLLIDMERGIPQNMKMKTILAKIIIELISNKEKTI